MKLKPILLILATLLIGFLIGFLTSSQLRHKRMKPARMFSSERFFREVIFKHIELSEEQKNQLEPILKKYAKEGKELQKEYKKGFDDHFTSYWKEMTEVLTEDQVRTLNEMQKKRIDEMRPFRSDSLRKGGGSGDRSKHRTQREYDR